MKPLTISKTQASQRAIASAINVGDSLYKPRDAAAYLNYTEGWLAKMRVFGNGPRFLKLGRQVRYRRSDLDAWVATNFHRSTSEYEAVASRE
jgi:predicted DNA-binding transcriptional regulator AlpA